MSASEAAGESSSSSTRARQDADAEAPQHRWVALVSTAVILADDGDDRARAMARGTDVALDLHAPPLPSYLVLHPRRIVALDPDAGDFTPQPSAYILAADDVSGRLLFCVTKPSPEDRGLYEPSADDFMYLCNTRTRRATPIPDVPYSDLGVEPEPRRSVGLIAHTGPLRGDYLIVQLCPRPRSSALLGDKLLCYCTADKRWSIKPLLSSAPVRIRNLRGETGVLAHAGRLYWLALAYGIFFCNPCTTTSRLRFVTLPADCETWEEEELSETNRAYVAQRRRVVPSDGHLRFVEIRGLSYDVSPDVAPPPVSPSVRMHTLVDPEGEEPWWRFECEVPFADVWAHESYRAAGLQHGEVPHVALVDPDDHGVVYFLQGSKLFGLDVRTKQVVSCEECSVRDDRAITLQNSRPIIDAWRPSPPTSSSLGGEDPLEAFDIDWEELKDPHFEVERVGFNKNIAYLPNPNPLRSILQNAGPAAPPPGPQQAKDRVLLMRTIDKVKRSIINEPDTKKKAKLIRQLGYLKKKLL